ncbi:hypothetical protein [Chryseobacterium paridis]|uniref:Uncharacterized protein n=1 Tax=Chryseobacterium paridis TaxID=2800328 RepID=A0ABS1FQT9_9FLAO|nr:hypothetical protein [Chryseobacterium paridis]MBK1894792.1 hypothetical protein [Chryseobacterium paridis]
MLNILKKLFFGSSNAIESNLNNNDINRSLKVHKDNIEVNKYVELGNNSVNYSKEYSFITPPEILKILNNKTLMWVDEKNNLMGISSKKESLLFSLSDVKNLEITNMLPAKGYGCGYFSIRLLNSKIFDISMSDTYNFDIYADEISEKLGVKVVFGPEFYNC